MDAQRSEPLDTERAPQRDVVDDLAGQGFTVRFEITDDAEVACDACGESYAPEGLTVHSTHRYEGNTNPGDEELIIAVICPAQHRGTMTLAYGTYASPAEGEVARRLPRGG